MGSKRKRASKDRADVPQTSQKRPKIDSFPSHDIPPAEKQKLFLDKSAFKEELAREDHDREHTLYRLLGSEDVDDRIKAADTIVSGLLAGDGVPAPVLQRHLERRLFRGLASGNDAARVGFSYVIVEILEQLFGEKNLAAEKYPRLSFDKVLGLLIEKTHAGGNIPGQEERDHYYGQLFGLKSFVQSGVVYTDPTRWQAVLQLLLKLGEKKVWLRPQAAFIIAQAIPLMQQRDAEKTLKRVAEAGIAKSPEGIGLWLAAFDRFPDLKGPKPWKEHPLSSKSLQEAAAVLKTSGKDAPEDGDSRGPGVNNSNATAQLHFVWDLILAHLFKPGNDGGEKFKLVWDRVVDQGYFSKGASDHQKLTGFKIFQKTLRVCASHDTIPSGLFSKNLMTCLMNQASSATPRLHRTAIQSLKAVEKHVEDEPDLLVPVLEQLLGGHGTYNFDQRIKGSGDGTKTVERILRFAKSPKVVETLRNFALKALDSGDDEKVLQIYEGYLFRLCSRAKSDAAEAESTSVGAAAFQELAALAYSKTDGSPLALGETARESCRRSLTNAAAALLRRPEDFSQLCNTVLEIDPHDIVMSDDIKPEILLARERLRRLVTQSGAGSDAGPSQGLAVLYTVSLLQLFDDPSPDAIDVLQDINNCFDKLPEKRSEHDSDTSDILAEVLLSMLAASGSLARQASLRVFEAFASYMSSSALSLLTDVLAAEESTDGFKSLFDEEEDEDEEMDDIEDAANQDEDGSGSAKEGSGEDESTSSSEEGDDSDSESDSDEEADQEDEPRNPDDFETILMKTFQVSHTLDKDHEADSSDSESDMSDSEMLALDEKLSGHLKLLQAKKNSKKQREGAKKKVIEFKHRVLDLLEVYVEKEAPGTNPLVFGLFPPLLELMRITKERPLSNKAIRIITKSRKLLKKARAGLEAAELDVDGAIAQLEAIHDAAHDPTENKAYAAAVSSASLAIAATLLAAAKENVTRVAAVYCRTQCRLLLENLVVRESFFTDWVHWLHSILSTAKADDS